MSETPATPPNLPPATPAGPLPARRDGPKPEMPRPETSKPEKPRPEMPRPAWQAAGSPASPPERSGRSALAMFCGLGFLVLAGGGFYLWQRLDELARAGDPVRVTVLESQMRLLTQRLAKLEQVPVPVPAPMPAPMPASAAPVAIPAPTDLGPVEQRLAALEKRPAPPPATDLGPVDQRLAALERRPLPAPASDIGPIAGRLETLEKKLAQGETDAGKSVARAGQVARLQVAGSALELGQPLGEIAGAPAALSRFALAAPPTEASLRLAFPAAAVGAAVASQPGTEGKPLGERMWTRISRLVTVRAGDRVLVGAPASVVLADVQRRLDAGDFGGGVKALDGLDPAAAAVMAGWRGQAQALLDARAALAARVSVAMARG